MRNASKSLRGFPKKRNATDLFVLFAQEIDDAFHNKGYATAAFIDFQKAHDTTWKEELIRRLYVIDIYGKICKWISSFLTGRTIQKGVDQKWSRHLKQVEGPPQGSYSSLPTVTRYWQICHLMMGQSP